jgi:hypothetical protein
MIPPISVTADDYRFPLALTLMSGLTELPEDVFYELAKQLDVDDLINLLSVGCLSCPRPYLTSLSELPGYVAASVPEDHLGRCSCATPGDTQPARTFIEQRGFEYRVSSRTSR